MSFPRLPDAELAKALGTSVDAVQLARSSDFLDLHVDTFISTRTHGYDMTRAHGTGPTRGRLFGHLDFPRAWNAGMTGGMWSVTTNPARTEAGRWRALQRNLARLRDIVERTAGDARVVTTRSEYDDARRAGALAILPSIQGGNALSRAHDFRSALTDALLVRVTLVHLTHSLYGQSNTPYPGRVHGLTDAGRDLVRALNAQRVFVDLAHAHPRTFWDALEVHDRTQPLLVTHTGVNGKKAMWRNIDDDQIRAVAATGGVVGVIFQPTFLKQRRGDDPLEAILEHLEHILAVGGEAAAAIGSDYDGFILPPPELRSGLGLPRLVDAMLRRGWSEARARRVLGENFLNAFGRLRP